MLFSDCFYIFKLLDFFPPSYTVFTARKIKFSIKDFFSKCDQIRSFLRKKISLMESFIFCAVFDMFWLNIIRDFKKTYNLVFNTTHCFFNGLRNIVN